MSVRTRAFAARGRHWPVPALAMPRPASASPKVELPSCTTGDLVFLGACLLAWLILLAWMGLGVDGAYPEPSTCFAATYRDPVTGRTAPIGGRSAPECSPTLPRSR